MNKTKRQEARTTNDDKEIITEEKMEKKHMAKRESERERESEQDRKKNCLELAFLTIKWKHFWNL